MVLGFGLSKPIIQPIQLGFGLSLAGMWQEFGEEAIIEYSRRFPCPAGLLAKPTVPHKPVKTACLTVAGVAAVACVEL